MADWGALLTGLFTEKGAEELKASKAQKKAVKAAAAQAGGQTKDALRASLQAFLAGAAGGFRLEGSKIVMAPLPVRKTKKDKKGLKAAAAAEAAAAAAAPAVEAPVSKKKDKKRKEAAAGQHEAAAAAAAAEAAALEEAPSSGKKKQKKRSAAGAAEAAAAAAPPEHGGKKRKTQATGSRQQDEGQAQAGSGAQQAAGAEDGEDAEVQLPSGKRRRKSRKAGGAPAALSAGEGSDAGGGLHFTAGGGEDGEGEDTSDMRWRDNNKRRNVKSGPFSKAEKETLRQAVHAYAAEHGLSTDSMEWLYASSRSGARKGLWAKIATALPQRAVKSVWAAGTRMFHDGNYQGKWTPEEDAQLLQLVSERGKKWKEIGGAVGRMPEACRDRWLMIRLGDEKKQGRWDEEETERLREAVAEYLAARTAAEQQEGAGEGEAMLTLEDIEGAAAEPAVDAEGAARFTVSRRIVLDDIDWNVVSQAVGSRSNVQCLEKWYSQLSPSMVSRGEWGSGDDRRLLRSLFLSGAAYDYELDWGKLVRGRTAAQSRRRWRLMLKVLPDHKDHEFPELVGQLVDTYLPALRERGAAGAATPAKGAREEGQLLAEEEEEDDGEEEF